MTIIPFSQQLADTLYNSEDQFPVGFAAAWQWLGYSRKSHAKESLMHFGFQEHVDFCRSSGKTFQGGRPSELILLTVDCFKTWGMLANTPQGKQIRLYFLECERIAKAKQSQRFPGDVYAKRLLLHDDHTVPFGYWTVFHESSKLLTHVEMVLKFPVEKLDLLDGSVGKHWAAYREGKFWAVAYTRYIHRYRDQRGDQNPKAYDDVELKYFRKWLDEVYIPVHLPEYLDYKRKEQAKEQTKLAAAQAKKAINQ